MKKATSWDAADYLETEADIAAYLNAAFEDGDTSVIAAALGDVARAKGMTQLAKETGITRDGLYKALSPTGNPSFDTVQKILRAFGLRLDVATSAPVSYTHLDVYKRQTSPTLILWSMRRGNSVRGTSTSLPSDCEVHFLRKHPYVPAMLAMSFVASIKSATRSACSLYPIKPRSCQSAIRLRTPSILRALSSVKYRRS